MTSSPNTAAATALRSLLNFGNSLLSELLRFRANLPRDFLRSITLPAPPASPTPSTPAQLKSAQLPSPSPDLPFPLWDFEYLRAPDDRERELRARPDEWSAERAWWTAHGEQLVGFVLVLAAALKLHRALRQTIEGLRRGLFLGSSLEGVVGGDEGEEMQSLLLQVLHTHALLLLLLYHLFPNQSRERLLIAAYRHWCRTSGPGSGEALGELLTRDFDDLCQLCRTTGPGSGDMEAPKGTAGGQATSKKVGTEVGDGSRASSDLDAFLCSPFPRECFDIEKLGHVSGLGSGSGSGLGSGLGSDGSGLAIGGAETAAFLSLPCVIAPTDMHSLEQLFARFAPPPDVTWMAIQSLLRKQAAAVDSSSASASSTNFSSSTLSSSSPFPSTSSVLLKSTSSTQAPSQAGAAGAAAPRDTLSAVAAVTASLPSTSSLILLLFFHPSSLRSDLPFMHELVHRRLLALPYSSSSSAPAAATAAAGAPATAAGGWSLWKQRAPTQQQQGGRGGGAVAAAGGIAREPAAAAAAVGGLMWVVPIFLGFSLDLSIAWQHFPAARSALSLHLSPPSALQVAQALAQVLPGVQQAVGRAMERLREQGEVGWEEEHWGAKPMDGGTGRGERPGADVRSAGSGPIDSSSSSTASTSSSADSKSDSSPPSSSSSSSSSSACLVPGLAVLRSAREILSLIRHTAALLRWLLVHRASLSLHLALPLIHTTHRLALSAHLHARTHSHSAAAAGLSTPHFSSKTNQLAAGAAGPDSWPEVADGMAVGLADYGFSSSSTSNTDSSSTSSSSSSWFGGWARRTPAPATTSTTIAPHPPPIPPPSDHDPLFTLLLSFSELQSEAATCLAAIIGCRNDSWHRLRRAACSRLDGLARLFVVEQGGDGEGRGTAGGEGRGDSGSGSRTGDGRGVGDGREGMASMGWKEGADGSIGEWFQRLSLQVLQWQHPDAPSTPVRLQQLSFALADAASLHHIQSHPLASQSLRATCRLLQDMALVQAIRADHLAALSAAAEPGFLWALLPSLLPWLQARVRLQPECLGQVGCLLVLLRGGIAETSADGTSERPRAGAASGSSAGASGVGGGGGGENGARVRRAAAAGGVTGGGGEGARGWGREEYLERHLRCVSRAVVAVVPASVLSIMHACVLKLAPSCHTLPPACHAPASTGSASSQGVAGVVVGSRQVGQDQWAVGQDCEDKGHESKAQFAARVHGQASFRQAVARARAAVAGFTKGVSAFEAKGLVFIGKEGRGRGAQSTIPPPPATPVVPAAAAASGDAAIAITGTSGTHADSVAPGGSLPSQPRPVSNSKSVNRLTPGSITTDEWAGGACHAVVVALRLMLRHQAAAILREGFSGGLTALQGAGKGQQGGEGKVEGRKGSGWGGLWSWGVKGGGVDGEGVEGVGVGEEGGGGEQRRRREGFERRVVEMERRLGAWEYCTCLFEDVLVMKGRGGGRWSGSRGVARGGGREGGGRGGGKGGGSVSVSSSPCSPSLLWRSTVQPLLLHALQQESGQRGKRGPGRQTSQLSTSLNTGTFLDAAVSSLLHLSHPSHAMFLPPLAAWFLPSGLPSLSLPLILRLASCLSASGNPHTAATGGSKEGAAEEGGPDGARVAEGLVALDWALRREEEERVRGVVGMVAVMERERRGVLMTLLEELREGGEQEEEEDGDEMGGEQRQHVRKPRGGNGGGGGGGAGMEAAAAAVRRAARPAVGMARHVLGVYGRAEHSMSLPVAGEVGGGRQGGGSMAGRAGGGVTEAGIATSAAKQNPFEWLVGSAVTLTSVTRALAEVGQVRLVRGLVRMAACAAMGTETPSAARSVECLLATLHLQIPAHAPSATGNVTVTTAVTSRPSPDATASSSRSSSDCVSTVELLVLVSLSHLRLLLLDPSLACLSRRTRSASAFDASCLAAGICCLLSTLPNPREQIALYVRCMEEYGDAEVVVGGLGGEGPEETEVRGVVGRKKGEHGASGGRRAMNGLVDAWLAEFRNISAAI
ncbi:hypothetical protein CLOM_g11162 [Closterium sp. NIES-68]|nr:hypothetical protein CLOM_g11162 [Closterium sp. NIES-68]GJP79583.1 hypothetical protein CLOP_g9802 [Closterium sp. NIES-67]